MWIGIGFGQKIIKFRKIQKFDEKISILDIFIIYGCGTTEENK